MTIKTNYYSENIHSYTIKKVLNKKSMMYELYQSDYYLGEHLIETFDTFQKAENAVLLKLGKIKKTRRLY